MSKNAKKNAVKEQEKVNGVSEVSEVSEVKVDDTLTIAAPSGMSFDDMKKAVEDFKRLQKIIKLMPKEDRQKLMPPIRKHEIPDSLAELAQIIFEKINSFKSAISEIFSNSVTTEKPDGNKSISLTIDECDFSVAIIRKSKKSEKK